MFTNIIDRLTSPNLIFMLPAIVIGLTVHEFSHAYASSKLGDPTPRFQGRVTLNPLAHIDPLGMIALLIFSIGWGKPVQIDDRYYKNRSQGRVIVSLAGPASNFVLAFVVAMVLRIAYPTFPLISRQANPFIPNILFFLVFYNVILGVFNLLPIPPLDGSKLLIEALPKKYIYKYYYPMQRYFPFIIIILFMTGAIGRVLLPMVFGVMRLFGISV